MAVHAEMERNMLVIEQIRCILFGVAYQKNEDFFETRKFRELVETLADNEDFEDILSPDSMEMSVKMDKLNAASKSRLMENEIEEDDRQDYWAERIKDFLLKSNEKWLLDQFNLCKRFINQNSIEGQLEEFQHAVFDRFSSIVAMKK